MREVQHGAHTVRSHGVIVAKSHKYDWLTLMLLVVIKIVLNSIHPFYRYVGKGMMTGLKYPLKDNTVPVWAVPMYAGILFSLLITMVITDAIKNAVGWPRPDFFWRCFPDGKEVYDNLGNVVCHGKANIIKNGYKSFPSGHTSWSFAGLGFLSLYLSGKIKAFDHRGHVAKLCIVSVPLLVASLVGISRVDDYRHHWQDVFAGGLLGLTVATFCYLQFFPPPYHTDGWGPYKYFLVLEESCSRAQPNHAVNIPNVQGLEVETVHQQGTPRNNEFPRLSDAHDSSPLSVGTESRTLDEMESGRR
ncbi:putative lipid phosphate phosphatase 3, chloroplastic isoform X2 [Telopea speciosissima]|uniref:putative lipid phosphate phosphatase 3, chloroplastic isoform X2 n=1 Tax=Telopea speciosissima TaxID=54955 RepID=UPI001CC68992|nr:putative lipid phosphate phosphatase 3, chloroplastic isoform X2 [Telopea speciosissima]